MFYSILVVCLKPCVLAPHEKSNQTYILRCRYVRSVLYDVAMAGDLYNGMKQNSASQSKRLLFISFSFFCFFFRSRYSAWSAHTRFTVNIKLSDLKSERMTRRKQQQQQKKRLLYKHGKCFWKTLKRTCILFRQHLFKQWDDSFVWRKRIFPFPLEFIVFCLVSRWRRNRRGGGGGGGARELKCLLTFRVETNKFNGIKEQKQECHKFTSNWWMPFGAEWRADVRSPHDVGSVREGGLLFVDVDVHGVHVIRGRRLLLSPFS